MGARATCARVPSFNLMTCPSEFWMTLKSGMLLFPVWGLCTELVAVMTGTVCCWDWARLMWRPELEAALICLLGSGPALLPLTSASFSSPTGGAPEPTSGNSGSVLTADSWSLALLSPGITVSAVSLCSALPGLLGNPEISEVLVVGLLTLLVELAEVTALLTSTELLLCLSVKSIHVHLPRLRGSVVSTFTTLNLVLKSCGPTTTG